MNIITNTPVVREHAILAAVGEKSHVGVQTAIERASEQGNPQAKLPVQTQPLSSAALQNALNSQDVNFGKVISPAGGAAELPGTENKGVDSAADLTAVQNFGNINTDNVPTDTTHPEGPHLKHKVVDEISI